MNAPRESANGWAAAMVLSHIDDVTKAVPTGRRKRRAERRAWTGLLLIAGLLTLAVVLGMAGVVAW